VGSKRKRANLEQAMLSFKESACFLDFIIFHASLCKNVGFMDIKNVNSIDKIM
jgi:hypothetical protein